MIFRRLGLIHKNQRGFTLIELVIAIAITGLITSGITMTIFQVISGNARSSNHMIAIRQVQNAGYWVSHDAQMAQPQYINTIDNPVTPERELVTLSWADYNGSPHTVIYTLDLVSSELWRDDGVQPMRVAEFIDPDPTKTRCVFPTGGTFDLPDAADAYTITGGVEADSGTITVTNGSILVTTTGTATYDSGTGAWATSTATDTVVVTAAVPGTAGAWTSTTRTATADITTDSDGDATVAGVLALKVTATVGEASETRTYEVIPRPS